MNRILIVLGLVFILLYFCQVIIVFICLMLGDYYTKKKFFMSLIPSYPVVIKISESFKELK